MYAVLAIALGTTLSAFYLQKSYGTSTLVTSGTFFGCYTNTMNTYFVCWSRIYGQNCSYTYGWDFSKFKYAYFWKCYEIGTTARAQTF